MMAAAEIFATPYNGSLLAANLLATQQTLLLSSFGQAGSGTLVDDDGTLGRGDSGVATFNGRPITYIGSGTVQPGVKVGVLTVPLGAKKDVVLFSVDGKIHMVFPDGEPNLLGAVALVVDVKPVPYTLFTPVCFVAGTGIATPDGDRPVETLVAGDLVLDCDGAAHPVIWAGGVSMHLPAGLAGDPASDPAGDPAGGLSGGAGAAAPSGLARWLPVVIPRGAFGPGRPRRDLRLSQQHRVMIEGAGPELLFGAPRVLVPAVALVGDIARLDRDCRHVSYHHILCARHVVLCAEGLPAESLLPGPQARNAQGYPARAEAEALFADLPGGEGGAPVAALPVLRRQEGRMLSRMMMAGAGGRP